jgi:hypothetical protein
MLALAGRTFMGVFLFIAFAYSPTPAQQPSGKVAFDAPPDWIQAVNPNTGITSLAPRALPPGGVCLLLMVPAERFTGSAEMFHDDAVRRAVANVRVLEAGQRHTVGQFLVTSIREIAPPGVPMWVAIYTARWGDVGQALLFSTGTEELMRAHLPVVENMMRRAVLPQVAPAPTATSAATPAAAPTLASAAPQTLPTISIDPPENFYRSAGSDANVQWFDSTIVNATLRIYSFRAFAGDAAQAFRETLFRDWTNLDVVNNIATQPVFDRTSIAGAETVLTARFLDSNGRSHLRFAVVANGGRAVSIIHVKAETPQGLESVLPSVVKVLSTMRINNAGAARVDGGPSTAAADTRAVAGLYMVPRLKLTPLSPTGSVASTYFYLFSSNGRVYRGYGLPSAPAGDINRFDYAAATQEDPENTGTFEIRGRQLVIKMGWQYPYTITTDIPDDQGKVTIENSTFSRQVR